MVVSTGGIITNSAINTTSLDLRRVQELYNFPRHPYPLRIYKTGSSGPNLGPFMPSSWNSRRVEHIHLGPDSSSTGCMTACPL